jgi:hypothetical protein
MSLKRIDSGGERPGIPPSGVPANQAIDAAKELSEVHTHQAARPLQDRKVTLGTEAHAEVTALAARTLLGVQPQAIGSSLDAEAVQRLTGPQAGTSGTIVPNLDSGTLRRGEMQLRARTVDGARKLEAVFHLMPQAHERLVDRLSTPSEAVAALFSRRPEWSSLEIAVQPGRNEFQIADSNGEFSSTRVVALGEAIDIRVGDRIRVTVSTAKDQVAFSRRVWLQVDGDSLDRGLEELQRTLDALDLGDLLNPATPEELELRAVMLALHQLEPAVAYQLSLQDWAGIDRDALASRCNSLQPGCWDKVQKLLAQKPVEQVPGVFGSSHLAIPAVVDLVRREGAVGLMMGASCSLEVLQRIAAQGAASGLSRYESGNVEQGTSTPQDFRTGGGGCVFTRLVTKRMLRLNAPMEAYPYSGSFQLLYSLDALATSCYGYPTDRYGSKLTEQYAKRHSLPGLALLLSSPDAKTPTANEIMFPGYLSGDHLCHILVDSNYSRQFWIDQLREQDLLETVDGLEYLKGHRTKTVQDLFVAGTSFKESMWSSS